MVEQGYVYVMSNQCFDNDIFKIGYTTREPATRVKELSNTSVFADFHIVLCKKVDNCKKIEECLHTILNKYRINKSREFFKINLNIVKVIFDALEGDYINKIENDEKDEIVEYDEKDENNKNKMLLLKQPYYLFFYEASYKYYDMTRTSTELYSMAKDYTFKEFSITEFGSVMTKIFGKFKHRSNSGYFFKFGTKEEVDECLKNYNPSLYWYINDY
jgi:hypothetical protein